MQLKSYASKARGLYTLRSLVYVAIDLALISIIALYLQVEITYRPQLLKSIFYFYFLYFNLQIQETM